MTTDNRVIAVVPARYQSSRFPGKPLAEILDRPMIEWVVEGVEGSELVDETLVATDDARIHDVVEKTPARPVMTDEDISSGSDRVAAVVESETADLVLNVQGDEPLVEGSMLDRGIRAMRSDSSVQMGTFMTPATDEQYKNSDDVKVVVDKDNRALYFSRSPIPHQRGEAASVQLHLGIYLYRRDFLLEYSRMEPTPLERSEKLEQLRALENGASIKVVPVERETLGVDRPEDVPKVEQRLKERQSDQEEFL
ncbi:MAG: 3-deoxy-manno-octulosonate cytidylyltransferase [bacterium]